MKQISWTTDLPSLVTSGMSKEVKKLLKKVDNSDERWRGRRTAKGHLFLVNTDGRMVTIAGTPSDMRTLLNSFADLNREKVGV